MKNIIVTYSALIVSLSFLLISFININPYKLNLREYIALITSISLAYIFISFFDSRLASLPVYFLPILFIYKKNKKLIQSFILQILICIVIIVINSLISIILLNIFGQDFFASDLGYCITFLLILIGVYFASKGVSIFIKKYDFLSKSSICKYSICACILLVLTFGLFYVNINWNKSSDSTYLSMLNGSAFTIYGIIVAIMCVYLIRISKKEDNFKFKQAQLDNLKEYTDNLEMLYMDMRKFRHDYVNMISTMAGFIQDGDMTGLEAHFNKHIYPLNSKINKNNYKLGLLKNIELPEIKGLISAKVIHAQESSIDVLVEIIEPIQKINMDIIDLSRCLGIILDNAIEAALESIDKKIHIAFINKNNSIIIVVTNSTSPSVPSLSKIFKQGFSTKGDNRGLGLSNLKDIINKYNNIYLDTSFENNTFIQEITISNI